MPRTIFCVILFILENKCFALAGVAQWIEHWPANERVVGSISSQGTCLDHSPSHQ